MTYYLTKWNAWVYLNENILYLLYWKAYVIFNNISEMVEIFLHIYYYYYPSSSFNFVINFTDLFAATNTRTYITIWESKTQKTLKNHWHSY